MTRDEAAKILDECQRDTLSDYTFGDSEVLWMKGDVLVAEGYFSRTGERITFQLEGVSFEGEDARVLRGHCKTSTFERNDAG